MFRFLRSFRSKLMIDGKFRNYLFYALGEILLVVIGILLALQIDNWNEDRKDRRVEREILETLYTNLGQDSLGIAEALSNNEKAIHSIDRLFKDQAFRQYPDSAGPWLGSIICFDRIQPRTSGFEVLKSKGLELVSDEELRLDLTAYYDETLTLILQSLGDIEESFKTELIPDIRQKVTRFRFKENVSLKDPGAYLTDISTMAYYQMYRSNRTGTLEPLQRGLGEITALRSRIRRELDAE